MKITESDLEFGEYDEAKVFHIEESKQHKELNISFQSNEGDKKGLSTCEFVLLRNGALCFIEAKSSCPRALRENLSEEDKAKKKEDYDRFVREISEKMKDSIELFGTILLKRHEQTGLSEEMYEAGLVGSQIKPIVVVNTKGAGWNPDPEVQDSIRGKLGPITKMWNMRPILIINEIKAREKHLIV